MGSRRTVTIFGQKAAPSPGPSPTAPGELTSRKLKVTLVLVPDDLLAVRAEDGKPRVVLRIRLPDRKVSADVSAKSLRKSQTAVRELGADNVAVILQGSLVGDAIMDAGLATQPKARASINAQPVPESSP